MRAQSILAAIVAMRDAVDIDVDMEPMELARILMRVSVACDRLEVELSRVSGITLSDIADYRAAHDVMTRAPV